MKFEEARKEARKETKTAKKDAKGTLLQRQPDGEGEQLAAAGAVKAKSTATRQRGSL